MEITQTKMPINKNKIKELLGKLNSLEQGSFPDTKSLSDEIINKEYADTTAKIKESSTIKYLDAIHTKLENFKKDFDLKPVSEAISSFQDELQNIKNEMTTEFDGVRTNTNTEIEKINATLIKFKKEIGSNTDEKTSTITERLDSLKSEFEGYLSSSKDGESSLSETISEIQNTLEELGSNLTLVDEVNASQIDESSATTKKEFIATIEEEIRKLRMELLSKISQGGGNMNRNMTVGGNASTLSRYTDINFKAGSNVTITYTSNNATKFTDITFSSSGGGGGSVIGTTRSINNISTSQGAGNTSLTDYVYICTAGVNLTLPTASGNTNLYTVKNTSTSSVLVTTTGGETIDNDPTVIMPIRYTSVDLISDGTNWQVT